jgi:expansin (peptidoglycan-binding protein)
MNRRLPRRAIAALLLLSALPAAGISRAALAPAIVDTLSIPVHASWNMISLPVVPADGRISVLFPGALSAAFSFETARGYRQRDTLRPGVGYWIKFPDSGVVRVAGIPVKRDTVALSAGWNLIGGIAAVARTSDIVREPPGVVVSGFFSYAGGYAEDTSLVPGGAYWVKAAGPGLLIVSSSNAMSVVHTGEATYYTFADGSGNCMFDPTPSDLMVGAMNQTDYDNSAICGSCATVTGPEGVIDIRIVDRCPECAPGDIDLSPLAFSMIADTLLGRVPISWHLRPCDVAGPIAYHFKDGANQWWTAVQIRNHRNPVASLEYLVSPGLWKSVARVQYNYFVEPAGMGAGPYTFRVTDIFANVLVDGGIPLTPDATVLGTGQFP